MLDPARMERWLGRTPTSVNHMCLGKPFNTAYQGPGWSSFSLFTFFPFQEVVEIFKCARCRLPTSV
jgi:hypothetical protein